jgi:hypothetical protein
MEIGTTRRMATSFYSYIRRHPKELVHRAGTVQRNCQLGGNATNFVITFSFEHENPMVDTTLKVVRDRIFEEPEFEIVTTYQNQNRQTVRQLLHCYHVAEEDPTEENPCVISTSQK